MILKVLFGELKRVEKANFNFYCSEDKLVG